MDRRTFLRRTGIACVTIGMAGCAGPGDGGNETGNDTGVNESVGGGGG